MSPIIDLQQRLQEVGRIRLGAQVPTSGGKKRPARLEAWRLTSRDEQRLQAAAEHYGGDVKPWEGRDGEFELFTTSDALRVLIIPGQALTQWWEMWTGGGCVRRCDGAREVLTDGPCLCPPYDERAEQAAEGKACKPTTRLAVLLPDVPGIGCWRLETHSYYAAVELAATAGVLEEATRRGALLPARLRIDVRRKVAGGKTTVYPVPVIDLDITTGTLIELGGGAVEGAVLALPAPPTAGTAGTTVQPQGALSVARALDRVTVPVEPKPRANAAEPIAAVAPLPTGAPYVDAEESPVAWADDPITPESKAAYANERQRRLLWATVRGKEGMTEDDLRKILHDVTGQESTASIPAERFEAVLSLVYAWSAE